MKLEEARKLNDEIWSQLITPRGQVDDDYDDGLVGLGIVDRGEDSKVLVSLRTAEDEDRVRSRISDLGDTQGLQDIDLTGDEIEFRVTGSYRALGAVVRVGPGTGVQRRTHFGEIDGPIGALGAFVSKEGRSCLLGAEHVLNNFGQGGGHGDIHRAVSTNYGSTLLAELAAATGPNYNNPAAVNRLDCAMTGAVLGNWDRGVNCFGRRPFERLPADPKQDDHVLKCGSMEPHRTSGRVKTVLTGTKAIVLFPNGQPMKLKFEGQIDIEPDGNRPFGLQGDSGATVVRQDGNKLVPVGLLFAGSDEENSYLANPMTAVQAALGFDYFV